MKKIFRFRFFFVIFFWIIYFIFVILKFWPMILGGCYVAPCVVLLLNFPAIHFVWKYKMGKILSIFFIFFVQSAAAFLLGFLLEKIFKFAKNFFRKLEKRNRKN